jgi:hypothetical protein
MLILSPLRLRGRRSTATSRPLISTSWLMYSLYCPSGSVELISSLKQGCWAAGGWTHWRPGWPKAAS